MGGGGVYGVRADSRRQVAESYSTLKNFNERAGCPALVVRSSPPLCTQVDTNDDLTVYSPRHYSPCCYSVWYVKECPPPFRGLVWHDDLAVLVGKTQSNMSIPKATHTIMSTWRNNESGSQKMTTTGLKELMLWILSFKTQKPEGSELYYINVQIWAITSKLSTKSALLPPDVCWPPMLLEII